MTFVQATFLLGTFVHISNISDLTDPILTKLLGPNFLGASIFVGQNPFCPTTLLPTTIFLTSSDKLQNQLQIQLQLQLLALTWAWHSSAPACFMSCPTYSIKSGAVALLFVIFHVICLMVNNNPLLPSEQTQTFLNLSSYWLRQTPSDRNS